MKLKLNKVILEKGEYVIDGTQSDAKDYCITFKGEKLHDVLAIIRMGRKVELGDNND